MLHLPEQGELHPAFHNSLSQIRWAERIVGILMVLFAGVPLIFMPEFIDDLSFYIYFVVFPIALAWIVTIAVLRLWVSRPLIRASGLIYTTRPAPMRMLPLGITLKSRGREKAALYGPEDPEGAGPQKMVWIKTPGDGALAKKPFFVKVYEDRHAKDRFTVIQADTFIVWGRMEDGEIENGK